MTYGTRLKDAIQWHEGMLLRPHHFQQADRRMEQLLAHHLSILSTHPWGVLSFMYDSSALVTGLCRILTLEAVFPDGCFMSFHQGMGEELSLNLEPFHDVLQTKPLTIYVTLPEYEEGKANAGGKNARFRSCEKPYVVDENTGEGMMTVPSLQPNYGLQLADTPPSGYVSLPLIKVQKINTTYQVLDFIPPHLKVTSGSALSSRVQDLIRRIREKAAFLSERLTSDTSDVISAQAEHTIALLYAALLPLEAMIDGGVSHPFDLYVQLNHLAGQLTALSRGKVVSRFMPYHHNEIQSSFSQVIDFIDEMLTHIQEGYAVIPFTKQDRIFSLQIKRQWGLTQLILGAKMSLRMSEKEMINWIDQAVIATEDHVTACKDKRILGAPRTLLSGERQSKLMTAQGIILFSVENTPEFIGTTAPLHIFNIADTPDLRPEEILLYLSKNNQAIVS